MASQEQQDCAYLAQAIKLARRGAYSVEKNPLVGCVLVKNGEVLSEGWHQQAGQAHAEVDALNKLSDASLAQGATAYVSLEPCSHQGKTGPCAEALIQAGVSRVVCAMVDPAAHVSGRGIKRLEEAGVDVDSGLLEAEARALNPGFIKRAEQGRPYVRLKMAMSLDGKTALNNGESKWITGEAARNDVHRYRARSHAIVTGIQTVLADDPQMTARIEADDLVQPLRVVLDSKGRLDKSAKIVGEDGRCFSVGANENNDWQIDLDAQGKVDLSKLLNRLAEQEVNEVWVEAGSTLSGAFVEQGLVDELIVYMAPVLLGDKAQGLFDMKALESMQDKLQLKLIENRKLGEDLKMVFAFADKQD